MSPTTRIVNRHFASLDMADDLPDNDLDQERLKFWLAQYRVLAENIDKIRKSMLLANDTELIMLENSCLAAQEQVSSAAKTICNALCVKLKV